MIHLGELMMILDLYRQGLSVSAIARQLGVDRKTVRKYIACGLEPPTLVAARFVQAIGASGPIVLGRAIVRDLYEGARAGRELSRMSTIMGVVPAAAPIFGGLLYQAFGWRSNFAACIAFGVALAAVILTRMPETIPTRSPTPVSFLAILRGFRSLFAHRSYPVYVALSSLAYGGLFAFISGSSFVLQGFYGLSELAYAFSFAFMVIGFMAHPSGATGGVAARPRRHDRARRHGLGARRRAHAGARGARCAVVPCGHRADGALRGRRRAHHAQSMASAMGAVP